MTASLELQQANLGSERVNLTDVVLLPQDIEQVSWCSLEFMKTYIRSIRSSVMSLQLAPHLEQQCQVKEYVDFALQEWRRLGKKIEKLLEEFEATHTPFSEEELEERANNVRYIEEKREYYANVLEARKQFASIPPHRYIRVDIEVYEYEYLRYLLQAETEIREFIRESSVKSSAKSP